MLAQLSYMYTALNTQCFVFIVLLPLLSNENGQLAGRKAIRMIYFQGPTTYELMIIAVKSKRVYRSHFLLITVRCSPPLLNPQATFWSRI